MYYYFVKNLEESCMLRYDLIRPIFKELLEIEFQKIQSQFQTSKSKKLNFNNIIQKLNEISEVACADILHHARILHDIA